APPQQVKHSQRQRSQQRRKRSQRRFGMSPQDDPEVLQQVVQRRGGVGADDGENVPPTLPGHPGGESFVEPKALPGERHPAQADGGQPQQGGNQGGRFFAGGGYAIRGIHFA